MCIDIHSYNSYLNTVGYNIVVTIVHTLVVTTVYTLVVGSSLSNNEDVITTNLTNSIELSKLVL